MERVTARRNLVLLLLAVLLCLPFASARSDLPPAERGRQIASGGGPDAAQACFSCHGVNGAGDSAGGFPRLAGIDARYLAKQLNNYAEGTRQSPIMMPIAQALSEADRAAVSVYYAQLPPAAPQPVASADPKVLQRGAALYARGDETRRVQACINCHGPAARGVDLYPALAGQPAAYVRSELEAWRAGQRTNDLYGQMRTIAENMSEADIEAVSQYLSNLSPQVAKRSLLQ